MKKNLPTGCEPLELIAPLPIEWEISTDLNEFATCKKGTTCDAGTVTT